MEAVFCAARHGDKEGMTKLFGAYEPLLRATGRRYQSGVGFEEAYQEACVAFLEAVWLWQSDFGVPFPAFAKAKVRGDVRTAMRRIWRYEQRRMLPTVANDGEQPVHELWDGAANGLDFTSDEDTKLCIRQIIGKAGLSDREKQYVNGFLQGKTPRELAAQAGVSTETVKTWRKRAFQKLRTVLDRAAVAETGADVKRLNRL